MKQFLLYALLLFHLQGFAQTGTPPCKPDPKIPAGVFGILPEQLAWPRGIGTILDTACLNSYFEEVLTIKLPTAVNLLGVQGQFLPNITLTLDSAALNLPKGIQIACDPPNCQFNAGATGCVTVRGVLDGGAEVGVRSIAVKGVFNIPTVPLDSLFQNSVRLALYLLPDGSPACKPSNVSELAATQLLMRNTPNPFQHETTIEINSGFRGKFDFRVYDFSGQLMHRQPVQLLKGDNRILFDGSHLPNGIYVFSLTDGLNSVSRKMVIHR